MNYDFTLLQGSDFELTITLKDSTDAVRDLTGKSFRGQARKQIIQAAPDLEFEFEETDLVNGEFKLKIPAALSTALNLRQKTYLLYDVEMFDLSSVERIIQGKITLDPEVTR
jgi:hypothetical protein